jgi:hypothetical protein
MNCWEYKKCSEDVFKTCPAYPDSGSSCWMLAEVKCQGAKEFSSLDEQIACCGKCDFYDQTRKIISRPSGPGLAA